MEQHDTEGSEFGLSSDLSMEYLMATATCSESSSTDHRSLKSDSESSSELSIDVRTDTTLSSGSSITDQDRDNLEVPRQANQIEDLPCDQIVQIRCDDSQCPIYLAVISILTSEENSLEYLEEPQNGSPEMQPEPRQPGRRQVQIALVNRISSSSSSVEVINDQNSRYLRLRRTHNTRRRRAYNARRSANNQPARGRGNANHGGRGRQNDGYEADSEGSDT